MTSRTLRSFALLAIVAVLCSCETALVEQNYGRDLVNAKRVEAGVAPLDSSAPLMATADGWAVHLRDQWVAGGCGASITLDHSPNLVAQHRPQDVNPRWSAVGENIGYAGISDGDRGASIRRVQGAYEASPSHRATQMDRRYRWTGQGLVSGPTVGQLEAGRCPGVAADSMLFSVQVYVG